MVDEHGAGEDCGHDDGIHDDRAYCELCLHECQH